MEGTILAWYFMDVSSSEGHGVGIYRVRSSGKGGSISYGVEFAW